MKCSYWMKIKKEDMDTVKELGLTELGVKKGDYIEVAIDRKHPIYYVKTGERKGDVGVSISVVEKIPKSFFEPMIREENKEIFKKKISFLSNFFTKEYIKSAKKNEVERVFFNKNRLGEKFFFDKQLYTKEELEKEIVIPDFCSSSKINVECKRVPEDFVMEHYDIVKLQHEGETLEEWKENIKEAYKESIRDVEYARNI